MIDFLVSKFKRLLIDAIVFGFNVYTFGFHFCKDNFGPLVKYYYSREPTVEKIDSPYYASFDYFEEDQSNVVYQRTIDKILTNDIKTLFPIALHEFSERNSFEFDHANIDKGSDDELNEEGNKWRALVDRTWVGKINHEQKTYYYQYSMFNNDNRNYDEIEKQMLDVFIPSTVDFLFIEYTHPNMVHSIEFKTPKEYMICNNEIFTPGFILELLKKQDLQFHFDLNYSISLVDENIQNISLDYKKYIILDETSYHIKTIE